MRLTRGSCLVFRCAMSLMVPRGAVRQGTAEHLVFLGANVIDGASERPLENATVVVRNVRVGVDR